MNEKLQRLSTKMLGLFTEDFESVQDCYNQFRVIYKTQFDYFQNFDPSNIIKLVFYIYSLKNTGNFKLAEQLLNKLGFASLIITQGNYHEKSCDNCYGDGDVRCDDCGGSGEVDCNDCDGTGEVSCDDCDGTGVDEEGDKCGECGGDGEADCSKCGGDGEAYCSECNNGYVICDTCDGTGEITTNELEYIFMTIATWNNEIKTACELNAGTMEPILSEYHIDTLRDEYIILVETDEHGVFQNSIDTNEYYCTKYEDEPKLHKSNQKEFFFWMDDDGLENYIE
jgi:hypothetical protein